MPNDSILSLIANNPMLMDELRALFEKHFSTDDLHGDCSNEELGQMVRARLEGMDKIHQAFKEIAKYETIQPSVIPRNPAR